VSAIARPERLEQAPAARLALPWRTPAVGLGLVSLALLLRLPFLGTPLTADEGGYAEIARLWSRGDTLYRSVWVDRPQGLLLAFRGVAALGLTSAAGLRIAAAVAAAALALLVAVAGARLLGRRAGALAGLLAVTAGASPFIEGFTLAGELLAAACAAAAIAVFAGFERQPTAALLMPAGLLAGSAMLMKQSGFDAALAILATILATRRWRALPAVGVFVVAAVTPIGVAAVASRAPSAWFHAVVGYGAHASLAERSGGLGGSLPAFARALVPLCLLALAGWSRSPFLVRAWIVAAALGVCAGGNFHAHYYLQLVGPLAVAGAAGAERLGRRGSLAAGAVALLAVLLAAPLWVESGAGQARALWPSDRHLVTDSAVARYVRAHTTPSQPIYVLWAAADVYYLADRRPAYRYLWLRNLQTVHGAVEAVDRLLLRHVPALVVEAQPAAVADPSGRTAAILRREYRPVRRVAGVLVLAPRERRPPT
jgi:hypothetical protein